MYPDLSEAFTVTPATLLCALPSAVVHTSESWSDQWMAGTLFPRCHSEGSRPVHGSRNTLGWQTSCSLRRAHAEQYRTHCSTLSYSFLLTRYNTASKLQHISVKLQSDYIHRLVTEHYRPAEDVEHNVDRAQQRSEHDTKMYKGQINHPSFVQQQSDVAEF